MARLVLICLLVSNVVVGVAGYVLLREMDRNYAALVESSLPALNTVRALSWQVALVQRAIHRFGDAHAPARDELLRQQVADMREADALSTAAGTEAIAQAHRDYMSAVGEWRRLASLGDSTGAVEFVAARVRPAYDAYGSLLERRADEIQQAGLSGTSALSARNGRLGGGLVLVAAWPLWLAGFGVAFLALCALPLGLFLRWRSRGVA